MHIKKIVIQGFKTYKNTTTIEDLSPHHNVIVGRNGSGKSNFFAAIRFVLSDQYTRMSKEERQSLIHEGSGTVLSAYVEIVFDNSDGRFPTGKNEVVVRRTIGLKKDDYSLDYKSSTRMDIMQLLESAGFSKSNPYYIVPQGRITSLTNAKDHERLTLLKEVAGAKVFENKLKDSIKEMTKTLNQKEKIDEMLGFIDGRLSDLDSEKEELKKFQKYEKEKKIFEFILYDRELNEITTSIEEVDNDHQAAVDDSHNFVEELDKREHLVSELQKSIDVLQNEIKILNINKSQLENLYISSSKKIYNSEANLNEARGNIESVEATSSKNEKILKKLQERIHRKEVQLSTKKPELESLQRKESELKNELSVLRSKQNTLYSIRGRYANFSSVEERNNWIQSEIQKVNEKKSDAQNIVQSLVDKSKHLSQNSNDLELQVESLQNQINGSEVQSQINEIETSLASLKKRYASEVDARRALWRDENRYRYVLSSLEDEVNQAQRQLNHTMDKQQSSGLTSVKNIAERLGLEGIYGPLGELISVNEKYRVAVESVAGNSLFHVVVDTDETASTLMEELVRERSGRVTFIPLNRLHPKDVVYPDSNDSVPLIKKIAFDPQVEKAIRQVFGRTIVAINLERGQELGREFKLNAITLDGDRADRKGVLSGGYHDFKTSRLESMKTKQEQLKKFNQQEHQLSKLKSEILKKDQEIVKLNSEIAKLSNSYEELLNNKKTLKVQLSNLLNEKFKLSDESQLVKDQIVRHESALEKYNATLAELNKELKSEFQEGLSSEERSELQSLTQAISDLEKRGEEISDLVFELSNDVTGLEIELSENLKPRYENILKQRAAENKSTLDTRVVELTEKLENLREEQDEIKILLDEAQDELDTHAKELKMREESLSKADDQQRQLLKKLENFQKSSEKYLSKRSILISRRDETQRKIRELGALPEEAFSDYQDLESETLLRKLTKVTKHLEEFQHVNKKASDQYMNFTKQRDGLVDRRKELDRSEESVDDLIKVLKGRKDEAIQRTFEQVSKAFSQVFEKLVPRGFGKLVMQTVGKQLQNINNEDNDDDDEMQDSPKVDDSTVDNYVGVSIKVSFNSKNDDQQHIEQLSGGQKSLCAIALILAIQKSDPAPFYLFDEIDANLDTQYRTAVANLIHELSENAQFICTTFRPEMLHVANKFFGVMFSNKISTVREIDRNDALGFVEGQQQQDHQRA